MTQSLPAAVQENLDAARGASSGRSARTMVGGHDRLMRQTVIALVGGRTLADHENPGEATVQVLHGRVRLTAGDEAWEGQSGDLLLVPDGLHALEALEDSAVLLTALHR